jgi:FkbM family methyltransferase
MGVSGKGKDGQPFFRMFKQASKVIMNLIKRIYAIIGKEKSVPGLTEEYIFDANSRYDLQTFEVIKRQLKRNSNTIDVGAHKGDILIKLIEAAPEGTHFAFEPIPALFGELRERFGKKAIVYPFALGGTNGTVSFNLVTSNPAYSGLLKRKYDRPEKDECISVEMRTLDEVIPAGAKIDLIKIDVEGAEFGVVKGAAETLKRSKPIIIYEQGLGGADVYKTDPGDFFEWMAAIGYNISLMEYYLNGKQPLSKEEYCQQFWKGYNYYFIAY